MDVRSRRILAVVIMLAAAIASIWWIDRRVQDQMDRLGHHVRIVEPGAMENDQP
jgi:Tfp pilus assembly protein FimT